MSSKLSLADISDRNKLLAEYEIIFSTNGALISSKELTTRTSMLIKSMLELDESDSMLMRQEIDDIKLLDSIKDQRDCNRNSLDSLGNAISLFGTDHVNIVQYLESNIRTLSEVCSRQLMNQLDALRFTTTTSEIWKKLMSLIMKEARVIETLIGDVDDAKRIVREAYLELYKALRGPIRAQNEDWQNHWNAVRNWIVALHGDICNTLENNVNLDILPGLVYLNPDSQLFSQLETQNQSKLARSIVCDYIKRFNVDEMTNRFVALHNSSAHLYSLIFEDEVGQINSESVHLLINLLYKYDEYSDEKMTSSLRSVIRTATEMRIPLDESCEEKELQRISNILLVARPPIIEIYHGNYFPIFLNSCASSVDKEVALDSWGRASPEDLRDLVNKITRAGGIIWDSKLKAPRAVILRGVGMWMQKFNEDTRPNNAIFKMQARILDRMCRYEVDRLENQVRKYKNIINMIPEIHQDQFWESLKLSTKINILGWKICTKILDEILPVEDVLQRNLFSDSLLNSYLEAGKYSSSERPLRRLK